MSSMYLVTNTKTRTDADPEREGALIAVHSHDVTVQRHMGEMETMFERKKLGDHSLTGLRVFELEVADDGTPKVGKEVTA